MTRYFALLAIFCAPALFAQDQPPKLLLEAAHCLMAKNFLPQGNKSLRLGYFLDAKSYPGDKAMYVVDYTRQGRAEGYVFTIFITPKDRGTLISINNNGKFVRSVKASWGIKYIEGEDPLGGIWTQEHIALAIKRIEHQRTYTVAVRDLSGISAQCESYADPR